ncbi:MAG: DUF2752 domain-containing protein [Firmicutes bacterium]|nr:DUF2752 domain-containing protein [Bacillota bacterium]
MLKVAIVLLAGVLYYIWVRMTELKIPCLFRTVTGLMCPGCGITTMIMYMGQLRWLEAYEANPFLFITMPFLLLELGYVFYLDQKGKKHPKWNQILLVGYIVLLILFGIARNII